MYTCLKCNRPCDPDEIKFEGCIYCLNAPYSIFEYREAKKQGLDLDNWNDYEKYFGLGEEPNYDDM